MNKNFTFTLAILKPHIFKNPFAVRKIEESIVDNGFKILKQRNVVINGGISDDFYGEHKNKFFYQRLISFMSR
jgi:nucleoside-diphosphate kinase